MNDNVHLREQPRMELRVIKFSCAASRTCILCCHNSSSAAQARVSLPFHQAQFVAPLSSRCFWSSVLSSKNAEDLFPAYLLPPAYIHRQLFRTRAVYAQSSKVKSRQRIQNNECLEWWEERMKDLRKPVARELTNRLSYTNLLGLDDNLKNGSFKEGSLNGELLEVKAKFPREVLLCRVGEFYEAVGFDACILVEYASLNPMSGLRSDTVPRAGCPVMNLRQTLDALTSSGFSVCVYEEVKGPSQGRQRKDRFISGHAHPGSPYVYGLAEANIDLEVSEEVFVIGISKSARGYCMVSVSEMMRTFSIENDLTEEAMVTKLRAKTCYHLFLHRSLRDDSTGISRWGEYGDGGLLWAECKGKLCEWFDHDPVLQIISKVKTLYDLDPEEQFREVVFSSHGRPKPLHLGTAAQIGILPTTGVPSLLKVLLPADSTKLSYVYLRDLLLNPPPPAVAMSIQAACRAMGNITSAVPEFTCVSAAKLVKLICSKEANHIEFSRIQNLAEDVILMNEDQQLGPILTYLLDPTSLATGLKFQQNHLVSDCMHLVNRLDSVLAQDDDPEQRFSSFPYLPDEFFQCMESSWRGRIRHELADEFYNEVQEAAKNLNTTVENDFVPVLMHIRATDGSAAGVPKAEITFSREFEAVWLKVRNFSGAARKERPFQDLIPAGDGKGKRIRDDLYTTLTVEMATERYKLAVANASSKVFEVLRSLSEDLKGNLNTVVFISVLAVIARTLFAHVSEARRRSWSFPDLLNNDQIVCSKVTVGSTEVKNENSSNKTELVLNDLIPYWVDKANTLTVPNSLRMSSLLLLTGPNGGGKSSILRSIAAASLLGICGLMVPASFATIPWFDAVMLRMMPQDSPADGKSSFQMEMSELRTILLEVTNRSLVLIDELCRGTEVQKGTSIAASVIEYLDSTSCFGVLSTHLHSLFDMDLNVKGLVPKAMGTKVENGILKPTWKLEDGYCRESLAFETARNEGIPESILERSRELYLKYSNLSQNILNCTNEPGPNNGNTQQEDSNGSSNDNAVIVDQALIGTELKCSGTRLEDGLTQHGQSSIGINKLTQHGQSSIGINQAVVELFTSICKRKLMELYGGDPSLKDNLVFTLVGKREQPPPIATNNSCVYLMLRPDGKFYVGQTDNIAGRIKAHRGKQGLRKTPFLYVQVSNKSVASNLETVLINELPRSGLYLVNAGDQNHKHFGTLHSEMPF